MLAKLFDFYQNLLGDGVIFCSTGPLNQEVIENLAETLRTKVKLQEVSAALSMKVFSVFVEQVQNIVRYSEDKVVQAHPQPVEYKRGICLIGHKNDQYFITSGNLIHREDEARIAARLALLRQMDTAELKAYYLAQRKEEADAHSKGAGLGLIDMVRRGKALEYHFQQVDDQYAFFAVTVVV